MKTVECRNWAVQKLAQYAMDTGWKNEADRLLAIYAQHDDDEMVRLEIDDKLASAFDTTLFLAGHVVK